MQPDAHGTCHSYYGRTWNVKDKPKSGVVNFMLDEYVKNTIEKERLSFVKTIDDMVNDFNKDYKKSNNYIKIQIEKTQKLFGDLRKLITSIAQINGLELPKDKVLHSKTGKIKAKKKNPNFNKKVGITL